jgi:hypothetical protein
MADDPPLAGLRAELATAIAVYSEERDRLDNLEQAQSKVQAELRDLAGQLSEAADAVERAKQRRPGDLVSAYVRGLPIDGQTTTAESVLEQIRGEQAQKREVEAALAAEIRQGQTRLRLYRSNLYEAVSDVVAHSPELAGLFEALDRAWRDLRSIRRAFYQIDGRLKGYFPGSLQSRYLSLLPLDPATDYPEHPIDPVLSAAWESAIEALLADSGAPLPG